MTGDWATPAAIVVIALVAFAMRCGGYIVIDLIGRRARKALKLAPGHLFTAFMAAAVVQGVSGCDGDAADARALALAHFLHTPEAVLAQQRAGAIGHDQARRLAETPQ